MYMIEDRGIINLTLYPRFNIIENNNAYRLCAFTCLETDHEIKQNDNFRKEGLTLMTFENEVDAEYALWHLFGSFEDSHITTWDPDDVKKPSEIWKAIIEDYSNDEDIHEVLSASVLSLSNVKDIDIDIGYDQSIVNYRDITEEEMLSISDELKVAPLTTIKVRWNPFDETQ